MCGKEEEKMREVKSAASLRSGINSDVSTCAIFICEICVHREVSVECLTVFAAEKKS